MGSLVVPEDPAEDVRILTAARALIEDVWGQGGDVVGTGKLCALNAVARVCSVPGTVINRSSWCCHILRRNLPGGGESVVAFNDDLSTTKEDVLALYDRAIASVKI